MLVWLFLQSNSTGHLRKKLQFFFLEPTTTVLQGMTECLHTGTFGAYTDFLQNKAFESLKMPKLRSSVQLN